MAPAGTFGAVNNNSYVTLSDLDCRQYECPIDQYQIIPFDAEAHICEQLAQSYCLQLERPGVNGHLWIASSTS